MLKKIVLGMLWVSLSIASTHDPYLELKEIVGNKIAFYKHVSRTSYTSEKKDSGVFKKYKRIEGPESFYVDMTVEDAFDTLYSNEFRPSFIYRRRVDNCRVRDMVTIKVEKTDHGTDDDILNYRQWREKYCVDASSDL